MSGSDKNKESIKIQTESDSVLTTGVTPGTKATVPDDFEGSTKSDGYVKFPVKNKWSRLKKIVVGSAILVIGLLGYDNRHLLMDDHKGDSGPKFPPHYAYTLKASKDAFENAKCPKDRGNMALKHFDSLFNTGLSGTKADAANSVVRAVIDNNLMICADDLPGDQGGMKMKNGMIVVDTTMKGEPAAATEIYMIMYELNVRRGTLNYSPQWSLLERQTHLMSFEAAALMAPLEVAYQKKFEGDGSMWVEMALDNFTGPIARKFEQNVPHAMKRSGYIAPTSAALEEAGKMTFPEVFNDPGFSHRYNNWLLNTYVKEMYEGKLKGRGTVTAHEFASDMGRIDASFNAVAGSVSAPMYSRFGGDQKMIDAFKSVEMFRREMLGSLNAGDMNVLKADRAGNLFGKLDMAESIKVWADNGFNGNFKDHLENKAGLKNPTPAAKAQILPPQVLS